MSTIITTSLKMIVVRYSIINTISLNYNSYKEKFMHVVIDSVQSLSYL